MHSSQKRGRVFRIPCGDTSPTLQFQEGIFNKVSKPIKIFIVIARIFATVTRRDDGINKHIAVIFLVCLKIVRIYSLNKFASLRTICNGTCCNNHSNRHTMRIHGQMYL